MWIEIPGLFPSSKLYVTSRLARALWIEIDVLSIEEEEEEVEARESLVD